MPKGGFVLRKTTEQGPEKRCVICGEWWPITSEFFQRDNQKLDGFDNGCKACRIAYRKRIRAKYHEAST